MTAPLPESGGTRLRHVRDERGRFTGVVLVEPTAQETAVPAETYVGDVYVHGWLTIVDVRERWPESLGIDDTILQDLIVAAREQCREYAPALPEGAWPPATHRVAHLMQTQALWKSAVAGPGDTIGPDGLTITVFPLDRTVKALLRPRRGAPVVG